MKKKKKGKSYGLAVRKEKKGGKRKRKKTVGKEGRMEGGFKDTYIHTYRKS